MLDNQLNKLSNILSNEDLQKYTGDGFWNIIQMVVNSDVPAGVTAMKNIKELIFHIPTILFWDKMKRYLLGTFSCYEDQVKMSAKFTDDNKEYTYFIKKQIHLINEIDDDKKIDYFASLTRSFLLTELDEELFFKLAKFIVMCTPNELKFLANVKYEYRSPNTALVSSLYQYGLFMQIAREKGGCDYALSDFAKALKQNSLNFNYELNRRKRFTSYDQLEPLCIAEPMTNEEIDNICDSVFNNDSEKK